MASKLGRQNSISLVECKLEERQRVSQWKKCGLLHFRLVTEVAKPAGVCPVCHKLNEHKRTKNNQKTGKRKVGNAIKSLNGW